MKKVACFGECIIGLNHLEKDTYQQTFLGNSLRLCFTLKEILKNDVEIEYITVLGKESFSQSMMALLNEHDIKSNHIHMVENKNPTIVINEALNQTRLSSLNNTNNGIDIFNKELSEQMVKDLEDFDVVCFSLSFLTMLSKNGRVNFFKLLKKLRLLGINIAYDSLSIENAYTYDDEERSLYETAINYADIFFTSVFDEKSLWGDSDISKIMNKAHMSGCKEVIINGLDNTIYYKQLEEIKTLPFQKRTSLEFFNGAYLAYRLINNSIDTSILYGLEFTCNRDN